MSTKSRHSTTIASIALALALLGLFFVAGTRSVRAEEITLDETKVDTPIEEVKVDTEAASVTEDQAAEPEIVPETIPEQPAVVAAAVSAPAIAPAAAPVLFAISDEFGSVSVGLANPVAGGEGHFITGSGNGGPSGEGSFTTLGSGGNGTPGEGSFTTLPSDGGPCTVNCGGGGGGGGGCIGNCGGGGGGSGFVSTPTNIVPLPCPLFLREFIHIGRANNPFEVRKLQAFLNVFMGEHLPITGVYSQADFDAVSRLQAKYLPDVLTPWGIDESTGYVFITTRLAINNIYCNRSTANDLDLRNYYPTLLNGAVNQGPDVTGLVLGAATTTLPVATSSNLFQAATVGLINFFKFNPGCVLIALLALAILFMFFLIWKLSKYPDTPEPDFAEHWPLIVGAEGGDEDQVVITDDGEASLDLDDDDPTQPPLTG